MLQAPVAWAGRSLAVVVALVLALVGFSVAARADVPVPAFDRRCNDLANVFSPEEREDLERRLIAFEQATGQQIAILTVPTLDGEPIEDFSYRVAKAWKVGRKGKDDGVLVTLALAERRMRIEVGKGIEGDLTDLESSLIIREKVKPFTKDDRWYDAFSAALAAIEIKLSGKAYGPVPKAPAAQRGRGGDDAIGIFFTVLLLGAVALIVLRAIRGGRGGGGRGGGPPIIFFGGWPGGGGGYGGGGGFGGGGYGPPSGGGGDFGGGGASDDV